MNLDPDALRSAAHAAIEAAVEYYSSLGERSIMPPISGRDLHALLAEPLPHSGGDLRTLIETVREDIFPNSRHNGHPRFFGYVASPGTSVAAIGDLLSGVLNANVTSWRSSPVGAELEHITIGWIQEMLGYSGAGLYVSGGSMANFTALAMARAARSCKTVFVSEEGHFSVEKAARLLGIEVRKIPTDDRFRMRPDALEKLLTPEACVVANAGTVSTGAVDPLEDIAAIAAGRGAWLHVDGCYGGFAALAPSARPLFRGLERADSVGVDPHKWLHVSMGCGCLLFRDPAASRTAFGHDADYTRVLGFERDESFAFWDYGPELSRPFRALDVWLQIKCFGADALGAAIERNIACTKYLEELVRESEDFEMAAPVELSIFCFRRRGPDDLNRAIVERLQRGGHSYLSNATLRGRFALRGCVLNYRTTERDMEILLDDVRRAASN